MRKSKTQANESRKVVRRVLSFILRVVWKERPSLLLVYMIMLVAQLLQKIQVVVIPKFLIDELMLIIGGASPDMHVKTIMFYVALICGMTLVGSVISNMANHWRNVLSEWFLEHFEILLAEHAMKMDFEYTEEPAVLEQINRAKEGINVYSGGVVGILNSVYNLIGNIVVLLGVSVVIVIICPILLPVQFVGLLLISMFNAKNNKVEVKHFGELAKINRVFGYYLYQLSSFSYGKEIRLYDSADMMLGRTKTQNEKFVNIFKKVANMKRTNTWGMDFVNATRDGISYFCIGLLVLTKKITIGDFTMLVTSASELYRGMYSVVGACQDITKRCVYANQFLILLEYPEALEKGDKKVPEEVHTIEFSHVYFKYPRTEQYILKDINLKITTGEHLSVVGLNGAGKTTFIKLLCRLYDVTDGAILIDGVNIKEYSEEEYRKLFAVVFQDFKLLAFSLKENIAFGEAEQLSEEFEKDINHVLEISGFCDEIQNLPEGINTVMYKSFDEKGIELSGGQQQKVAIARALYKNAPIVILDEPTASLDPIAEYDIYKRFDQLVGGKTAIYISHRLSSCKFCDRIAVFSENTIKEYGTHEELVNIKNGIYAELFSTQAQYYVETA